MWKALQARRRARILARYAIDDSLWRTTVDALHVLDRLDDAEIERLRELATLFLHQKKIVGAHELVVDATMRVTIAAQACLPILNLGLEFYRGWYTVILYPGAFVAHRETPDEHGIVHTGYEELDGESALDGPMALSWDEAQPLPEDEPYNVVVHECAHKLDELTGGPNGLPPLHSDMRVAEWSRVMNAAYEDFNDRIDRDEALPFDDYAGSDPAEFFAVVSELFFVAPYAVIDAYPDVYAQLRAFYRQDPIAAYQTMPPPSR